MNLGSLRCVFIILSVKIVLLTFSLNCLNTADIFSKSESEFSLIFRPV